METKKGVEGMGCGICMDGMRGYDDWKTTEPCDPYQEDYCAECGLVLAKCKCEDPEEGSI